MQFLENKQAAMQFLENKPYNEIKIGDTASLSRTLAQRDIELFAIVSGDFNPEHLDPEYAKNDRFHQIIAHGMWGASLISTVLGTQLPGPGTVYLDQSLKFSAPVTIGDTITITVTVAAKRDDKKIVTLDCHCVNQKGVEVISGQAVVMAPSEKIKAPEVVLPQIEFKMDDANSLSHQMIVKAQKMSPLVTAIVQPTDLASLSGTIECSEANLMTPILVGEEKKIRQAAQANSLNISKFKIIPATDAHDAVLKTLDLVKKGEAEAIMKGDLHTEVLMGPIVDKEIGIPTEHRLSHVFVMDVPSYNKLLFLTDAALNINPTLAQKVDIVQNSINLFRGLGLGMPKVACISATEEVNPKMPDTLDASALAKMAERGQIKGGLVDGPLAFDNAISKIAAKIKGIVSPVAGEADIIVVPEIVTGNAVYKEMSFLFNVPGAGIVLGARVPIILTSRADNNVTRLFSCAIALIQTRNKQLALKQGK